METKTKPGNEFIAECRIDPTNLQDAYCRLPADVAYWGEQYADACARVLDTKQSSEMLFGDLFGDPSFHVRLEEKLGKKPTVDALKGAIEQEPEYIAAREKESAAIVSKVRLRCRLDALQARRDMLINLGAQVRAELRGGVSLRDDEESNNRNED